MLKKLGRKQSVKQDQERLDVPPGQFITEKFPVLTFGSTPLIDLETWRFNISGLVEKEMTLTWNQFLNMEKITVEAEFHCVTQWSCLQNTWEGVTFNEVMKLVKLKTEAKYVMAHCYGGYSTNLSIDVMADDDVLFAFKHNGTVLTKEHGAPLRLIVPKRYGWKSAKWINRLEFMAKDRAGFWETRGYHMSGNPWHEERFWSSLA